MVYDSTLSTQDIQADDHDSEYVILAPYYLIMSPTKGATS